MAIEGTKLTVILPTLNDGKNNAKMAYTSKPLITAWSVVCSKDGELKEAITVRWYAKEVALGLGPLSFSPSHIYCNVWIRGNVWTSGHGSAGRGGYCKKTYSLHQALENAGVKLSRSIYGLEEIACSEALEAIATALGYTNYLIVKHTCRYGNVNRR